MACELESDDDVFRVLPEHARNSFLMRLIFEDTFRSVAALDESRSIPIHELGALFSTSDEDAEVIAQVITSMRLATLRVVSLSGSENTVLVL